MKNTTSINPAFSNSTMVNQNAGFPIFGILFEREAAFPPMPVSAIPTQYHYNRPPENTTAQKEAKNASTVIHVVEKKHASDVRNFELKRPLPIATPENAYKVTAHACTWRFRLDGVPQRAPKKIIQMRGWVARYWKYMGCTIQANKNTLFIHVKTRRKPSTRQAIYCAWDKADRARRAFSTWQQVGLMPEEAAHPAGAQGAHIVIETPSLKEPLNSQAFKPSSARVGLIFDKSHDEKPEMIGAESIEGGLGADWLFLAYPAEFRALREEMKQQLGLMEGENRALAQAVQMLLKRG